MFNSRLKELRQEKGLNMKQTATKLGLPYTTYVGYEKGEREPDSEKLIILSDFFECSVDYLIYRSDERRSNIIADNPSENLYEQFDNIQPVHIKKFRLLGDIACGKPIYADENFESYISADADINADFCLRAKGDSMIDAGITEGDIVFIHEQPIVNPGEIAAVVIDDEATLKRVYYDRTHNRLQLVAANPAYAPLVYTNEELNSVRILGKAVALMRNL